MAQLDQNLFPSYDGMKAKVLLAARMHAASMLLVPRAGKTPDAAASSSGHNENL